MNGVLEFNNVFVEDMGILNEGRMRITDAAMTFKNESTGKLTNINSGDLEAINWQRLGNKQGIRLALNDGTRLRFGGFKDTDFEKLKEFFENKWDTKLSQNDLVLKGWNFGNCEVKGKNIEFNWEDKPVFEIPISNVANCAGNKNEATLEFHQNDECPVSLMEMRFHMPFDGEDEEADPVEEFRKAVMKYAGIEVETGQPVAILSQILCTTPRGRYDIKVFPNHLSLHGKTYDYKIPIKTITRLFLVPHKDGRHVYFVISLNPPIRQGQTRYSYLVCEFVKEDEIELEIGLTNEQIEEQFGGKLEREMSGPVYEIVSKLFRVLVNMKITVPGSFIGNTGTPAIQCAHKQASGLLYPLEKGFLYIHKPPMYIRFEEISTVNFARSDVSTRTFDFEIEMKAGHVLIFNSIEKEEYNKLYDYVQNKHLRIRNAKKMEKSYAEDKFAGSDDEIDPHLQAVKAEGKERADSDDSDSDDDDYDLDEDLKTRKKEKNESEGSGSEPDEEFDSDAGSSDESGSGESEPGEEEEPKKKKEKKASKEREPRKTKEGEEKKQKRKKDPNAPKRGQSAYMIWFNDNRSSIKKAGDSVADTARRAGEQWKAMDADEKRPYEKKAKEDKERYDAEMKEYKKSGGAAASSSSSSKAPKASRKSTGPSPSKAISKEYISDSDDSDDDKPVKKEVKEEVKEEPEEKSSSSDSSESDESD
ncbi:unnamed protein product [Caenorhabditis auriculariae]|uniref:FACT complex subunit SSRP1 n=1 Tax=Caenorhabditis auriculariae TaxID=2777116 RepID=A0A8S1GXQ6_9PELO|nr:unnamed protein product [Caenorhabditis auriculariae]